MIDLKGKRVIISRTDSIGDVMLTLPICAWLKQQFPDCYILFLGKKYTQPIVNCFDAVDEFLDWDELGNQPKSLKIAKLREVAAEAVVHVFPNKDVANLCRSARIPHRIGSSHRSYHLLTCNHRINFTRKGSNLHESQLNHELLRPFGLDTIPELEQIIAQTEYFKTPDKNLPEAFCALKKYTILHPKSQGSAKEWPIEKYIELAERLIQSGKTVVFTGTEKEGASFRETLPTSEFIVDSTGKLSLDQLIVLISKAENLVACSTGPLHLAGYLGVNTVGLFSPKRPIHPGRWKALGPRVSIVEFDPYCPTCKAKKECNCIASISVEQVLEKLV